MRTRTTSITAAILVIGGAWLCATPGRASSTAPRTLPDLVRDSPQIVVGTVSRVTAHLDPGKVPFTEIQLQVSETIRGESAETLTFRQFGLQSPQPVANGRRYVGIVAGVPQYAVGEHVVLFLGPTSRLGLRTTIGFGQGRFALSGGVLVNGANNAGLFTGVSFSRRQLNLQEKSMVATQQGGVGADAFLGLVRRAVSQKWWDTPVPQRPGPNAPRQAGTAHHVGTEGGPIQ
jgi:hypothetical protein